MRVGAVCGQRRELGPSLRSHDAKRTMAAAAPVSVIIETPTFAWDERLVNTLVKSGSRCNGRACPKADDDCLEPPRLCLYNLGALDGGVERYLSKRRRDQRTARNS